MPCSMQAEVLELYQKELTNLSQRRAQAAAEAAASQASQRAAAQESADRRSLFACVLQPSSGSMLLVHYCSCFSKKASALDERSAMYIHDLILS